uniref:Uncharacterized protein n=1 Tax=Anguilla anguilla TaxID=7936 RepID=A0A0E9X4A0_ANGAN
MQGINTVSYCAVEQETTLTAKNSHFSPPKSHLQKKQQTSEKTKLSIPNRFPMIKQLFFFLKNKKITILSSMIIITTQSYSHIFTIMY